eukprot:scaffold17298_cov156-Skeletonema_menzelii.AAC.1
MPLAADDRMCRLIAPSNIQLARRLVNAFFAALPCSANTSAAGVHSTQHSAECSTQAPQKPKYRAMSRHYRAGKLHRVGTTSSKFKSACFGFWVRYLD